jgi:hypothetical protein
LVTTAKKCDKCQNYREDVKIQKTGEMIIKQETIYIATE